MAQFENTSQLRWTHLHEVLLQQAVDPRLSHLHGTQLVGDVAALDEHHLELHRAQGPKVILLPVNAILQSVQ